MRWRERRVTVWGTRGRKRRGKTASTRTWREEHVFARKGIKAKLFSEICVREFSCNRFYPSS